MRKVKASDRMRKASKEALFFFAKNTLEDMADKQDIFEVEGEVLEVLPNMMFRVMVKSGPEDLVGRMLLCTLAGKMRMYRIRVLLGDMIKAEVSKYDMSRGRITFRVK